MGIRLYLVMPGGLWRKAMSAGIGKSFKLIIAVLSLGTFGLLAPLGPATATVVVSLSFDSIITGADLIVEGTVTGVTSRWSDDHRTIYTFVVIAVHQVVSGGSEELSELTLRFEGGKVDDVELITTGLPIFHIGERNLLFVSGNGRAISPIVGFYQGKFLVREGRLYDSEGVPILGVEGGILLKPATPAIDASTAISTVTEILSAGEPVVRRYSYSFGPSSAVEEERSEARPPEAAPESLAASREVSRAPTSAVPAPTPMTAPPVPTGEADATESRSPPVGDMPGEPITLDEMIYEIRKRLPNRQRP